MLGVVESVVDPLVKELQLHLRRHRHLELGVEIRDVDRRVFHRRESVRIDGIKGFLHDLVVCRRHIDGKDLGLLGRRNCRGNRLRLRLGSQ